MNCVLGKKGVVALLGSVHNHVEASPVGPNPTPYI